LPNDNKSRALLSEAMAAFGANSPPCPMMPAHYHSVSLGALARNPRLTTRLCARAVALIVSGALPLEFVRALLIGRAQNDEHRHPHFHGLKPRRQRGKRSGHEEPPRRVRLQGSGEKPRHRRVEAVPMCTMNQQRWSDLYEERILHGGEIPGPA